MYSENLRVEYLKKERDLLLSRLYQERNPKLLIRLINIKEELEEFEQRHKLSRRIISHS